MPIVGDVPPIEVEILFVFFKNKKIVAKSGKKDGNTTELFG
jgi:hypothetical protein